MPLEWKVGMAAPGCGRGLAAGGRGGNGRGGAPAGVAAPGCWAVKRGRQGLIPNAVSPQTNEALASPADRGFGRMVWRPGSISCHVARSVGRLRRGIHPHRHLSRRPYAWRPRSLEHPASGTPLMAAWPADWPMPRYFRPGPERLPSHPTSYAPTTRHDPALVRATRGRIVWSGERDSLGSVFC